MSQFSNFVWDNGDKNGDSDGDVTDENFALKLKEGIVNMYTKGYEVGCIELGGKIKKVHFTYWLTLFSLYFLILRTIYFLAFFD